MVGAAERKKRAFAVLATQPPLQHFLIDDNYCYASFALSYHVPWITQGNVTRFSAITDFVVCHTRPPLCHTSFHVLYGTLLFDVFRVSLQVRPSIHVAEPSYPAST